MIRPTREMASSIGVAAVNAQSIAMASPARTLQSNANLGDGRISSAIVLDPADPNLLSTCVIQFYRRKFVLCGRRRIVSVYKWKPDPHSMASSLILPVPPADGDIFTIESNSGGTGDNSNGLALTRVQFDSILDGGTVSINENYGQLVASVGSTTRQLQASLDAQGVIPRERK